MLSNREFKKWANGYGQELRELYNVFKSRCKEKGIAEDITLNEFANYVYRNSDRRVGI